MKKRKIAAIIVIALALLAFPALAAGVSGTLKGDSIEITWQTGAGECELTVYQGDWPICVRSVRGGTGGVTIPVNGASGGYRIRLNAPEGCYTAKVNGPDPTEAPTSIPTEALTAAPASAPTATPASTPAIRPTAAPIAKPTAMPTSSPTKRSASVTNRDDLAGQVLRLVNEERAARGLGELRMDGELTRAACVRAGEIAQKFSHTRPDGTSWSTVSGGAYGENIAMGQQTAEKVIAAWMTSTSHRENILRASYGSIGICAYKVNGVMYWVQLFGK